ncbi:MFS transporter [Klenkia sp. PcliD-1-E]|uniref:MFS transporter n=1 Tax=Klenkia sp. PcliD-1-E TaxID=2954492 RepID=UPI00209787E2|nr:MFS transporter [Klenkia sp. PcliD-1-E]MCO7221122.1 MFS transporter [Klenkia sp. PcliD-1-E]
MADAIEQQQSAGTHVASSPGQTRRVVASSFLGSTVEFYDFLLYTSAAAVVFPSVFFSGLSPEMGIASFATLAIGFVARPVGSMVFGSLGDRLGRKPVLVLTMVLMGLVSTGIGALPSDDSIGAAAPVLLIALRLVQGLAVGGEWGAATALSLEHAPQRWRATLVAVVSTGAPAGSLLASAAMGTAAALTGPAFLDWGWRIPFFASAVLVLLGLYMRSRVAEAPQFERAAKSATLLRAPVRVIFTRHTAALTRVSIAILTAFVIQGVIVSYALNYAVADGLPRDRALFLLTLSSVVGIVVQLGAGVAADRYGRRTLMLVGTAGTAVLAFPMFWALDTGSGWGVFWCFTLGHGITQAVLVACVGSFVGEMFPTAVRTTASGLGYQLAGSIGGFSSVVAAALVAWTGSIYSVALLLLVVAVASTAAVLRSRETRGHHLPD